MGKTYQTTVVNAPMDRVWAIIRNFHDMTWASNVITSCDRVGTRAGDQIGSQRILNSAFHETLMEMSDIDRTFRYSLDDGPAPVSKSDVQNYIGQLRLFPITDTNQTFVEWSSSWTGNDEAACDFCHNIYTALLTDLRNHFS